VRRVVCNANTIESLKARNAVLAPAPAESTEPGIRVAAPGLAGSLDGTVDTFGSSNAAALATRSIDHIFDVLEQLQATTGE
jgi:hypothetical protein